MRRVHVLILEQSMQPNRQSPARIETVEEFKESSASEMPAIVLDAEALQHVAGGLSPKGTWGADCVTVDTTDSPKGTW
jgi:hypothetical protein